MRLEDFLAQNTETRTFKAGETIFTEGSRADAAYYVVSGAVDIYKGPEGRESRMARLDSGQIFGEMALLRFDDYTLSARAASDVVLHVIPPGLLHDQLRATPPLIRAIVDMLIDRIHGVNEVLIDLDRTQR